MLRFTPYGAARKLCEFILRNAEMFEWSVQGLGMYRLYLSPDTRLHIWSESAEREKATKMHTHPWDFESLIIAGQVLDRRFIETPNINTGSKTYMKQKLLCGEGGGLVGEPQGVYISELPSMVYGPGTGYYHRATDIHYTEFEECTVTLVRREFLQDNDHAFVYWPLYEQWGTAEPRPAEDDEIQQVVARVLGVHFGG